MKSNVWLRLVWSDYQLQWDEADYGGIGVLRLPPDKVWKVSENGIRGILGDDVSGWRCWRCLVIRVAFEKSLWGCLPNFRWQKSILVVCRTETWIRKKIKALLVVTKKFWSKPANNSSGKKLRRKMLHWNPFSISQINFDTLQSYVIITQLPNEHFPSKHLALQRMSSL